MKQINLKLKDNKAIITNNPIYLESNEQVEFVVTNPNGELFYSTGDKNIKIIDGKFPLTSDKLKKIDKLNIIVKGGNVYPELYELTGLKLHDVTVIGETVDERYPDVIKGLYDELKEVKKAIINLHEEISIIKKEGVIE